MEIACLEEAEIEINNLQGFCRREFCQRSRRRQLQIAQSQRNFSFSPFPRILLDLLDLLLIFASDRFDSFTPE